jgi:serine/threonine protein phosphatase PrpC
MDIESERTMPGLARYEATKPLRQEAFSELIRRKALASESDLASDSRGIASWDIGFASRTGNIRERNEDYGVAFNHQDHQVMIMGDGLGGPSHGDLASFMAVEAASRVVLDQLKEGMSVVELQELCSKAVWTAGHQLAWMGDKLNVVRTGLRTTLIMLIANREYAALTYIGDGAVYHYKSPTDCQSVLFAHKAIPGNLSLLSASLGPTVHGKPRSRRLIRTECDVIIMMSDGIADRIETYESSDHPPQLISGLMRLAVLRGGELQKVAEEAVEMLAEEQDEKGYLCDDNISLGFIGNHKNP